MAMAPGAAPDVGDDGQPPADPSQGDNEQPQMSVQDAQQVIQQLRIPPDALPMLAMAVEALDQAGLIQEPGDQGSPKTNPLDDAINAAKAAHGMPPGQ